MRPEPETNTDRAGHDPARRTDEGTPYPRRHSNLTGILVTLGTPYRPDETTCPICTEDLGHNEETLTHATDCKTSFHKACLEAWVKEKGRQATCPIDRQPIRPTRLDPSANHASSPLEVPFDVNEVLWESPAPTSFSLRIRLPGTASRELFRARLQVISARSRAEQENDRIRILRNRGIGIQAVIDDIQARDGTSHADNIRLRRLLNEAQHIRSQIGEAQALRSHHLRNLLDHSIRSHERNDRSRSPDRTWRSAHRASGSFESSSTNPRAPQTQPRSRPVDHTEPPIQFSWGLSGPSGTGSIPQQPRGDPYLDDYNEAQWRAHHQSLDPRNPRPASVHDADAEPTVSLAEALVPHQDAFLRLAHSLPPGADRDGYLAMAQASLGTQEPHSRTQHSSSGSLVINNVVQIGTIHNNLAPPVSEHALRNLANGHTWRFPPTAESDPEAEDTAQSATSN